MMRQKNETIHVLEKSVTLAEMSHAENTLCPWCNTPMTMKNFVLEEVEIGICIPEKWKQLVCNHCGARGPKLSK